MDLRAGRPPDSPSQAKWTALGHHSSRTEQDWRASTKCRRSVQEACKAHGQADLHGVLVLEWPCCFLLLIAWSKSAAAPAAPSTGAAIPRATSSNPAEESKRM